MEALQALHEARTVFGKRLETGFSAAFKELEDIGYPGVTDPKLAIPANVKPIDGLNHPSAVQYEVPTHPFGWLGYLTTTFRARIPSPIVHDKVVGRARLAASFRRALKSAIDEIMLSREVSAGRGVDEGRTRS